MTFDLKPDLGIIVCTYCRGPWDDWHESNQGRWAWWAHRGNVTAADDKAVQ